MHDAARVCCSDDAFSTTLFASTHTHNILCLPTNVSSIHFTPPRARSVLPSILKKPRNTLKPKAGKNTKTFKPTQAPTISAAPTVSAAPVKAKSAKKNTKLQKKKTANLFD